MLGCKRVIPRFAAWCVDVLFYVKLSSVAFQANDFIEPEYFGIKAAWVTL